MTAPPPAAVSAVWLGRLGFAAALDRQLAARDALAAGEGPPTLFAVEHPAVLTLGRRGRESDVLWSEQRRAAVGIEVCSSPRGGQVTLHAPGQLVMYPVVRIGWRIRRHMVQLGEAATALAMELGVAGAQFRIDHPGVWVGPRKLASVGVHVSRGITVQGIAINVDVDLALFGSLVSCGMADAKMTSLAAEGVAPLPSLRAAARRYAVLWAEQYGATVTWHEPGA